MSFLKWLKKKKPVQEGDPFLSNPQEKLTSEDERLLDDYVRWRDDPNRGTVKIVKKLDFKALLLLAGGAMGLVVIFIALLNVIAANVTASIMTFIIATFVEAMVIVVLVLILVFSYIRNRPVAAYGKCAGKSRNPLMLLLYKTGLVDMVESKYVDEIFETIEKDQNKREDAKAFFQIDHTPYRLGTAGLGIFYDGAGIKQNLEYLLCIQELRRKFGVKNMQEIAAGIDNGKKDNPNPNLPVIKDTDLKVPLFAAVDLLDFSDFVRSKPSILRAYKDTALMIGRLPPDSKFLSWQNPLMQIGLLIVFMCFGLGIAKSLNVF